MRVRPGPAAGAILLACLLIGLPACSNSKSKTATNTKNGTTCTSPNETQGVSSTEIRVGGIASKTNPLGFNYGEAWDGTQAYFDMVNKNGGVFGRKLKLVTKEDDQTGNNTQSVQRLLTQDNVFAVAPVASLLFTGASLLAQNCVPTFGWNINPQWALGPSLFGDKGSNLNFEAPNVGAAWLAQKLGRKKVGVLAYNIEESKRCSVGLQNTFKHFTTGAKVEYTDAALPYPLTDPSGDISQMKKQGVDFVAACVDVNGMVTIAREMRKQNFDATFYLPDGYYNQIKSDPNFTGAYAITFFAPFDAAKPPPGLKDYLSWLQRNHRPISEISLAGWVSADMLVTGIKAAGKNFTRSSVVAAINGMKDYTANGLLPPIDWTIAHTKDWNPPCGAFSTVKGGEFVSQFGKPGKPFLCFPNNPPPGPVPEPTFK